jgi:hypothetical protein
MQARDMDWHEVFWQNSGITAIFVPPLFVNIEISNSPDSLTFQFQSLLLNLLIHLILLIISMSIVLLTLNLLADSHIFLRKANL